MLYPTEQGTTGAHMVVPGMKEQVTEWQSG